MAKKSDGKTLVVEQIGEPEPASGRAARDPRSASD